MRRLLVPLILAFTPACGSVPEPPMSPFVHGRAPEVIVDGRRFTEGPLWDSAHGRLIFSDIPANELVTWSEETGPRLLRPAEGPNGNLLDPDGRHVTCLQGGRRVVRWEGEDAVTLTERTAAGRLNSPNDLVFAPDGALWFTDPPWGLERERVGRELPGNFVHRLAPGADLAEPVLTGLATPNGIALSPGGGTLYVSDTGGRRSHPEPALRTLPAAVHAFTLEDGALASTTPRWSVPERSDGMCVDRSGRVYLTGSEELVVLAPDGSVIDRLPLGRTPSNVCFGGADGATLYITSGASVLRLRVGARGLGR